MRVPDRTVQTHVKDQLAQLVEAALDTLRGDTLPADGPSHAVHIERTRDERHGDFATNTAMILCKQARMKPRDLAQRICDALPASALVEKTEIAGPGFINFYVTRQALSDEIGRILEAGDGYGRSNAGAGTRVLLEFISANPTGPLHVGHGRHAAYGACLGELLAATGHEVHREYYVNDAGRQMDILAVSLWLRYLEAAGENVVFPSNGYRGDYIESLAARLHADRGDEFRHPAAALAKDLPADGPPDDTPDAKAASEAHIDALIGRARELLGADGFEDVLDVALGAILDDIRDDLRGFGIRIDEYFSERQLKDDKLVQHAIDVLRDNDVLYEKDGALWFPATRFGDEKDRVVVRDNGVTTYFASDIAYHLNKRERGYDLLLDVLGADHHGYVARVRAGLEAMGQPGDSLEVRLVQFVALYRGGEKAQMSTRKGDFVTLRELREDVGDDAARFFYVMRGNEQHLDFDLALAKSQTAENPVYYIQYAHARICSVFRQLEEKGLTCDRSRGLDNLHLLDTSREKSLASMLSRYPEVIETAAANRAPQNLVFYLRDLANEFHSNYNSTKIIVDSEALRDARLVLAEATRQVVRNGLSILGVSAPQTM